MDQEQKSLTTQLERRSQALKNLYLDRVSGILSEGQFVELTQAFLAEKSRLARRLAQGKTPAGTQVLAESAQHDPAALTALDETLRAE